MLFGGNRLSRLCASVAVQGTVTCARTRKISNIARVKRIFLRRSGIVQMLRRRSHMGISFQESTRIHYIRYYEQLYLGVPLYWRLLTFVLTSCRLFVQFCWNNLNCTTR